MIRWCCLVIALFFGWPIAADAVDACERYAADFNERRDSGVTRLDTFTLEQRAADGLSCVRTLRMDLADRQRAIATRVKGDGDEATGKQPGIDTIKSRLSEAEEDLRVIGKQLKAKVAKRCGCGEDLLEAERQGARINRYFGIHARDRIYVDHNDYERYLFSLSIGYEYNSISSILDESSPRVGLLINQFYGRRPYKGETGFGYRGMQLSALLAFSGEKEQKTLATETTDENRKKLGVDIILFSPLWIHKVRRDLSLHTGPMVMSGVRQTDDDTEIRSRNYFGIRSAFNPEHFIDVSIGESPGLESTRMEVRGQMAVARLAGGSLIYVGIAANFGIIDEREDEEDVLTTYVTWSIDFTDLLATGG